MLSGAIGAETRPRAPRRRLEVCLDACGTFIGATPVCQARLAYEDIRSFDSQIGDAWRLVRRLLRRAHVETTMQIYREPLQRFQALEVESLLDALV